MYNARMTSGSLSFGRLLAYRLVGAFLAGYGSLTLLCGLLFGFLAFAEPRNASSALSWTEHLYVAAVCSAAGSVMLWLFFGLHRLVARFRYVEGRLHYRTIFSGERCLDLWDMRSVDVTAKYGGQMRIRLPHSKKLVLLLSRLTNGPELAEKLQIDWQRRSPM